MILQQLVLKNLIQKTIHLGHKKTFRNPINKPILIGHRKNIDIINLNYTIINILKIMPLISTVIKNNGTILTITNRNKFNNEFIGQQFNYGKWLPGSLTNMKSLKKTQKNTFTLKYLPNIVFLLTHQDTYYISKEVNILKLPFLAINDSNSNMHYSQYPIPGNDNSLTAEKFYFNVIKTAILTGYIQKIYNFKNYKNKQKISKQLLNKYKKNYKLKNYKFYKTIYQKNYKLPRLDSNQ